MSKQRKEYYKQLIAKMTFEQAKIIRDELLAAIEIVGVPFNALVSQYPKGPMGLTPDFVKAMPEYRALLDACNAANANWHDFAQPFNKKFKTEIRDEAAARRAAKIAANQAANAAVQ